MTVAAPRLLSDILLDTAQQYFRCSAADVGRFLPILVELLRQQVCPPCLLRLLSYTTSFSDYAQLEVPDRLLLTELLASRHSEWKAAQRAFQQQQQQQQQEASVTGLQSRPVAAATTTVSLKRPFDRLDDAGNQPSAKVPAVDALADLKQAAPSVDVPSAAESAEANHAISSGKEVLAVEAPAQQAGHAAQPATNSAVEDSTQAGQADSTGLTNITDPNDAQRQSAASLLDTQQVEPASRPPAGNGSCEAEAGSLACHETDDARSGLPPAASSAHHHSTDDDVCSMCLGVMQLLSCSGSRSAAAAAAADPATAIPNAMTMTAEEHAAPAAPGMLPAVVTAAGTQAPASEDVPVTEGSEKAAAEASEAACPTTPAAKSSVTPATHDAHHFAEDRLYVPDQQLFAAVPIENISADALTRYVEQQQAGRPAATGLWLDVVLPPAAIVRDLLVAERADKLLASCGGGGVAGKRFAGGIVPLGTVIRRVVGASLSASLKLPLAKEAVGADLRLVLVFQHDDSVVEMHTLAEDQIRMHSRHHGGKGGKQQQQQPKPSPERLGHALAELQGDRLTRTLMALPQHVWAKMFRWPPPRHARPATVGVKIQRPALLLAGRYLKLQRNIPQTQWLVDNARIGGVSLSERLEAFVMPHYGAQECKFISGGREDADVRMLGEGRPFVFEISNPRFAHPSDATLRQIEADIRQADCGVAVLRLQPCDRAATDKIKDAEESKEKTYRALCWADRPLAAADAYRLMALGTLTVQQDTPLRVLHRRSAHVRPKRVTFEEVILVTERPNYFWIRVRTQAGAYVKELVHGDFGRTHPNVGSLLDCRAEILQLDVEAVHMGDWP